MRASLGSFLRTLCLTSRFCSAAKLSSAWFGPRGHGLCALTNEGTAADGEKKKKKKRGEKAKKKKMKKSRARPTHFVALRVTDKEVKRNAQSLQEQLVEEFPEQKKNLIPVDKFHFTLLLCSLEGRAEVERARSAFLALGKTTASQELFRIGIAGVSSFPQGVLFAHVGHGCDSLRELAANTRAHFEATGLLRVDPNPAQLQLHLTLAKASRGRVRMPKSCLERFQSEGRFFGTQEVGSLQLCEMSSNRETGYYNVCFEMDLRSGEIA